MCVSELVGTHNPSTVERSSESSVNTMSGRHYISEIFRPVVSSEQRGLEEIVIRYHYQQTLDRLENFT